MFKFFILSFSLVFTPLISTYAQTPGEFIGPIFGGGSNGPEVPGAKLGEYYTDIINGDFKDSLIDPENDFTGFSITDGIQNNIAAIHLNSSNPCTGSQCETEIVPGQKGIPLQALMPGAMKSESDYLWNSDAVTAAQANLNSPQVVRDVTLFLTESAVAEGESNARAKSASLAQSATLQNIAFTLASQRFEGSQAAFQSYYWCLQNKMSEGLGSAKAHQICSADNGQRSPDAEGTAGNVTGFTFQDHPGTQGGNGQQIRLTDLLFEEEIFNNPNAPELKGIRDAFKEMYGDIEFSVANTGVLESKYGIIPGAKTPSEIYQGLIIHKFNTLRKIIHGYCVDNNAHMTASSTGVSAEAQAKPPHMAGTFGAGNVTTELLKQVSTPGFAMTPKVIEVIRKQYTAAFRGFNPSGFAGETTLYCDPASNTGSFAVNTTADFEGFYSELQKVEGRAVFRSIYHLARLLALAEWLSRAAIAEQVIDHLSAGINFGSDIQNLAKDLIYRAVGTQTPKFELERVNAQLREFVIMNFGRMDTDDNKSAQGGALLVQEGQK